jgi:alkylation response protein AidB-like acyl-CoA dehydrogenase
LLDRIAKGANRGDRERQHPYEVVELIRRSRIGALRIKESDGGTDATNRELFALIIRLGEADSNVAHVFRNHFSFVERFVRNHLSEKHAKWRRAVLEGAMFGVAYGELEIAQVGNATREGVELVDDWDGFGQRVTGSGTTILHDVLVSADQVVLDSEGAFLSQP